MESFRKFLSILIGGLLIVGGIVDECPRVATVAVGLLLIGAFTVPEALGVLRGTLGGEKRREDE